jgi:predicted dehydrogenase
VASFYKNMVGAPPYYEGAVDLLTCDVIHAVDALRWICGEPRKVASHIRALDADYENSFNALIEFESGASGVLLSNWTGGARVHTFEMHSKRFSAFVDPNARATIYSDSDKAVEITTQEAAGSDSQHKVYGFFGENRHFIDCVRSGQEPMTSFEDAAKTMELIDRINCSRI